MSEKRNSRSRAFSPVISAVILSTVVLVVGGAVWAFSQGAMTITAEDYVEAVINMTDTISERFIVEHVSNNSVGSLLYVWVFNYGDVDIDIKVNVGSIIYPENSNDWIAVASGEMVPIDPIEVILTKGEELNIKTCSRRGNNAYYRYLVP